MDYYIVLVKHIDKMSEGLIKESLDVGKIGTKMLMTYYMQIIHLEGLLVPFLTKEFYYRRGKIETNLPGYKTTWSGSIEEQMRYFVAISDLFQLLILFAYKQRVLKIKILPEWRHDSDIL